VKRLCREWFPIEYPDGWYSDITSNIKFYAVACVLRGQIIGLVVSEIKDGFKLPKEDSSILAPTFRSGTKIGYILSLGKRHTFWEMTKCLQWNKKYMRTNYSSK
jgi:hypothetical protein